MKDNPLQMLWFLTGSIGDALMALALCQEVAELNPGVESALFVRRDFKLVKDLAALVPSVRVEPARFTPMLLMRVVVMLARPWQVMYAWKGTHRSLVLLRGIFLLNPRTCIVRFDYHERATSRDRAAPYDMLKLIIDNFRILAQTAGYKTRAEGSPASLPIAAALPPGFALKSGSYIVLHPFGSNDLKSLPLERGRSILQALAAAYPQLSFVVTGSAQDSHAARTLVEGLPRTQAAVGLSILEVAGLIQNAALYIGVDTGITHLAAMMGKETLALEHVTHPRWFPTYNPKTVMIFSDQSDTDKGMLGIETRTVLAEVTKILSTKNI